ncbi:MAG TPA: AraC family transcriptional regulator [Chitinophagaceae bacterium]|nr:AraC family transcriptional regulator [Chitinophagaceae bacterium]
MNAKSSKLFIKNMVCQRCVMTVEQIFKKLDLPATSVVLGEAEVSRTLTNEEQNKLQQELNKVGFELIDKRVNKIVEEIKLAVLEYISLGMDVENIKLSSFITKKIPNDYSYLSDLFSSIEGRTIEHFFISQRIEKVKELLVYDQLSLTEISYQTGFSSVHHLSSQFKKVTGLTPSHFKKVAADKRKSIDKV